MSLQVLWKGSGSPDRKLPALKLTQPLFDSSSRVAGDTGRQRFAVHAALLVESMEEHVVMKTLEKAGESWHDLSSAASSLPHDNES